MENKFDPKFQEEYEELGRKIKALQESVQKDLAEYSKNDLTLDQIVANRERFFVLRDRKSFLTCIPDEYFDLISEMKIYPIRFRRDFSNYHGFSLAICHNHCQSREMLVYELTSPIKQDVFLEDEMGIKVPYCERCTITKGFMEMYEGRER